jgi:hypothetical protein
VCNAKLTAEVNGLGGSKISDVDLTVYDGVDDVCGRNGHGGGVEWGGGGTERRVSVLTRGV